MKPAEGSDKTRIEELEDAITDAGIILAGAEMEFRDAHLRKKIDTAMKRLDQVMKDPAVLRRQGI